MSTPLKRTLLPVVALAALWAGTAVAAVTPVAVQGLGAKHCRAYFHHVGASLKWPVMLSLRGTGVYTTATDARLDQAEQALVKSGAVTVLTLDKPGISPGKDAVVVDDASYNAYVQDDLVACAEDALAWAARHGGTGAAQGAVLLSGHSEGAQVALRLLAGLSTKQDPLAARVRGLFLSGLPMADWRHLLAAQLSPSEQEIFFTAFQRRDDGVLRTFGNLSAAYLTAAFATEPLPLTLARLQASALPARLYLYQGLFDKRTPAADVRAFVDGNRRRRLAHQPALDVSPRYYPTGHGLNASALRDIEADVRALAQTL
jgi:hypothetical protein